ncbi:unnamed protein product [Triticum turgidum subsp. durum]|uniref:Protein TIFY n=1 Tax=Triticum turgidum subsp. durum TaxID=4567 RepID=A0A9R1R6Z7_TRITD|nr:unnamed protein product [Triticum turgidum subsp. durum]
MAAASSSARDTAEGWRDGGSVDDGGAEVELSLRLRTGSSSGGAARRSMTIFYDGRVCAVDVTELQAREIITMASQQILTEQQDSSGGGTAVAQCGAHQNPSQPAPQRWAPLLASRPLRQGAGAAAPVTSQAAAAGLSMKRSLQQFLQKRKTRVAAMGSPYAGGRRAMPF